MTKAPQLPCPVQADKLSVLVHHHLADLYLNPLKARFPHTRFAVLDNYKDLRETLEQEQPDCVLSFRMGHLGQFPREMLLEWPSIRWLHATGAGIEHLPPWDPEKVMVTNSSGLHSGIMAEYAVWAVLHQTLRMPTYLGQQRRKEWRLYPVDSVKGKTAVIVGMGRVGRSVATHLKALGMRIVGVRRHHQALAEADETFSMEQLSLALAQADFLFLITPLTAETQGLFDEAMLRKIKQGAHFINLARGNIVDEPALRKLTAEGHLSGATFDVFHTEPLPPDDPMWDTDGVIVTPHASGELDNWQYHAAMLFADNLERWIAGRSLENLCDPRLGY